MSCPNQRLLFELLLGLLPCTALAQGSNGGGGADAGVRALLAQQAADWNRGDLHAFAAGYKNSPDILFISDTVRHGYADMLATYKSKYSSPAAMGKLDFSALAVQPLDRQFATCTGHFHLARSAGGGGDADGFFLLVLEKTPGGWKIVRDDTTSLPTATK